ncbi:MAG: hypothetical protein QXP01_00545 [Candidatus Hadarchaeum sp.]
MSEEDYDMFLDGPFLSAQRGKTAKEPMYIAFGLKLEERQQILGFCVLGGTGKRPGQGGGAEGSLTSGCEEGADLCDR